MTDERVGDGKRRDTNSLTIVGLLLAPIVGAMFASAVAIGVHLAGEGDLTISPTDFVLRTAVMGAVGGWPPAIVFGVPLHALLVRMNLVETVHYATCGALIGLACSAVLYAIFDRTIATDPIYFGFLMVLAGTASALVFWLIRRPDRDAT